MSKIFSKISIATIICTIVLLFLLLILALAYFFNISYYWSIIPGILLVITLYDRYIDTRRSLTRNFPLIARLRYLLEAFRPEIRQYFIEDELSGKPFNRRQRSIVYQRSKNEKQTISFGMQDDPDRIGYEWAAHTMYPKKADSKNFRVMVGGPACTKPYSLSVLNISAMSFGALSNRAILALNRGAKTAGFAHNTGEGGISKYHLQGGDLIWQVGTGYFGCRDENGRFSPELFKDNSRIESVKMIELKLSQGAKPGHGGLLPAEKNTPEIAAVRHIEPHTTVHSPATHSAFSDSEGLLKLLGQMRELSGGKPVGFKICIGRKDEFIELIETIKRMEITPDFITIDGAEGGTGAAPLEFIDNLGMSLLDSVSFASSELKKRGLKDNIKILASGKVITAFDIARLLALGADACYSARGMMFALGCIQALRCDNGTCPVGIATQNKSLVKGLDVEDKSERVANYHKNTMEALAEFIGACGVERIEDVNPDFFYRRNSFHKNVSYREMFLSSNDGSVS